jgi:hypothetical protein
MERYSINTPLPAIRLFHSHRTGRAGEMALLPAKAVIEIRGPSGIGTDMVEVTWQHQRFAVFEQDLVVRATLVQIEAVGD